jgi:hypothetical protein
MTCAEVSGLLLRYVASSAGELVAPCDDAVGHIASCPHCLEELAIVATLVAGRPSTLLHEIFERHACDLVEQMLPELVTAEVDGKDPGADHPAAWRHVKGCERCRSAFAEVRETLVEAEAGAFGRAPWQAYECMALPHVQSSVTTGEANAIAPERREEVARVAEIAPLESRRRDELRETVAPAEGAELVQENAQPANVSFTQAPARQHGGGND